MSDAIRDALAKLDVENDLHWTTDGLPVIEVMKELLGTNVSRAEITTSAKGFSRKTPSLDVKPEEIKPELQTGGPLPDTQLQTGELDPPELTGELDPPELTGETTELSESGNGEELSELTSEQEVEAALNEARANFNKAEVIYKKALAAMDVIIRKRTIASKSISQANEIKKFQKSQREQREGLAGRRRAMAASLIPKG